MSKHEHTMTSTGWNENYLDGEYVGAFSIEKPFGPHVRKCVCEPCHTVFLAKCDETKAKYEAARAAIDSTILAEHDRQEIEFVDSILADLNSKTEPKEVPAPANVKVGDRIVICGRYASNKGRIGTVIEMPGPSKKYGGRDAERIEVLLDASVDNEWETMWTDNSQYGWSLYETHQT